MKIKNAGKTLFNYIFLDFHIKMSKKNQFRNLLKIMNNMFQMRKKDMEKRGSIKI